MIATRSWGRMGVVLGAIAIGCVDGHDAADLAVGITPFEGLREWHSDTSAAAAWGGAIRAINEGLAQEPVCSIVAGPGFAMRIAEWDRGEGWSLSPSGAPPSRRGIRMRDCRIPTSARPGHASPAPRPDAVIP